MAIVQIELRHPKVDFLELKSYSPGYTSSSTYWTVGYLRTRAFRVSRVQLFYRQNLEVSVMSKIQCVCRSYDQLFHCCF